MTGSPFVKCFGVVSIQIDLNNKGLWDCNREHFRPTGHWETPVVKRRKRAKKSNSDKERITKS